MEKRSKIAIVAVAVVVVIAVAAAAFLAGSSKETISESGSTTMAEMSALWADQFENEAGIKVVIDTPGSGTGIANFINGKADIAQASRAMNDQEKSQAAAAGINVTEWKVAVDGIAIIVNKDVPYTTLTMKELEGIYNGTYTNWNQIGNHSYNHDIALYGRDSASGTYSSFSDMVFKSNNSQGKVDTYSSKMQQFTSNAAILPEVESNAGGIGYVGIGYAKQAQDSGQASIMNLKANDTATAYSPLDKDAVYLATNTANDPNGPQGYPLSRDLYLYTNGVPAKDSNQYKWIQYVLGNEGQQIVLDSGFYQLESSTMSAMQAQLATAA